MPGPIEGTHQAPHIEHPKSRDAAPAQHAGGEPKADAAPRSGDAPRVEAPREARATSTPDVDSVDPAIQSTPKATDGTKSIEESASQVTEKMKSTEDAETKLNKIANPDLGDRFKELGTRVKDFYNNSTFWEKAKALALPVMGLTVLGLAAGPAALVAAVGWGVYKISQSLRSITPEGNLTVVQRDRIALGLGEGARAMIDQIATNNGGKVTLANVQAALNDAINNRTIATTAKQLSEQKITRAGTEAAMAQKVSNTVGDKAARQSTKQNEAESLATKYRADKEKGLANSEGRGFDPVAGENYANAYANALQNRKSAEDADLAGTIAATTSKLNVTTDMGRTAANIQGGVPVEKATPDQIRQNAFTRDMRARKDKVQAEKYADAYAALIAEGKTKKEAHADAIAVSDITTKKI